VDFHKYFREHVKLENKTRIILKKKLKDRFLRRSMRHNL